MTRQAGILMRLVLRNAVAWTLAIAVLPPAPAAAEIRALLIGAAHYGSTLIPDLHGPENDLTAMETLVGRLGGRDIVVLREQAVSRSGVEAALQAMGSRARPGDWILFYYTGHGAEAAAQTKTTADGDYDQFLPLPGFDPDHQDPERFIVDKDFYAWLKRYTRPDVRVLMMVDSCHSGTMHRAVDLRAFGFTPRLAFRGDERDFHLIARPGPRLPPLQSGTQDAIVATREDLPNLLYIGASRDDQLALEAELPQEGSPYRGVLTFAFEQGLTTPGSDGAGVAADLDDDGTITVLELTSYLNSQVRLLSAQRQESTAFFPSDWADLPLFSALPPPRPAQGASAPAVDIAAGSASTPSLPSDPPWRAVNMPEQADFIWDLRKGDVLRRSGDVIASNVSTLAAFEGVIEKWRTILELSPLVSEVNMRMQVDPSGSDYMYALGTKVTVTLGLESTRSPLAAGRRYATVFDIASDGTVQLLYPLVGDGEGLLPPAGKLSVLEATVAPPYGADHVIAVATPDFPAELRAALRTADGQRASGRLIGLIRTNLKRAKGRGSLSIAELYTGS